MSKKVVQVVVGGALSFVCALVLHSSAHAATISPNVTTAIGGPTDCTLDDAFAAAQSNAAVNGCVAGQAYPVVDVISLGANTYHMQQTITNDEAMTVSGVSKSATRVVLDNDLSPSWLMDATLSPPGGENHAFRFQNLTFDTPDYANTRIVLSGNSVASLTLTHVNFVSTTLGQAGTQVIAADDNSTMTIDYSDVSSGAISVSQDSTAEATTNIANSSFTSDDSVYLGLITIFSTSSRAGDTTITNTEIDGKNAMYYGLVHYNTNANARVDFENSIITNVPVGINNIECLLDSALSAGSLYVTNSMIGGNMRIGLNLGCGHARVQDSTFNDIDGSAVVVHTNPTNVTTTRFNSRFESYNTTYANIRPDDSYYNDIAYVMPAVNLNAVVLVDTDNTGTTATGSRIDITHNTFADNTLGSYPVLRFNSPAHLAAFSLRNNAFEGTALSGSYTATINAVSHNLTTAAARIGISHVEDLVLAALADNGGGTEIGVNGAGGNVLTMMPLAASPLIDGAPSAGLNTDERGVARSLMGAYDVGAVEISEAEFKAFGGVWPLPIAPDSGQSVSRQDVLSRTVALVMPLIVVAAVIVRRQLLGR